MNAIESTTKSAQEAAASLDAATKAHTDALRRGVINPRTEVAAVKRAERAHIRALNKLEQAVRIGPPEE